MNNQSAVQERKIRVDDLRGFCGTVQYYRHYIPSGSSVLLTDGCFYLRKHARCHWLFDDIASHVLTNPLLEPYRKEKAGLFWKLKVNRRISSATLLCLYDKDAIVHRQEYFITDITDYVDMDTIDVWTFPSATADGRIEWVALLPGEY